MKTSTLPKVALVAVLGAFVAGSEAALAGAASPEELRALLEQLEALRTKDKVSITI